MLFTWQNHSNLNFKFLNFNMKLKQVIWDKNISFCTGNLFLSGWMWMWMWICLTRAGQVKITCLTVCSMCHLKSYACLCSSSRTARWCSGRPPLRYRGPILLSNSCLLQSTWPVRCIYVTWMYGSPEAVHCHHHGALDIFMYLWLY